MFKKLINELCAKPLNQLMDQSYIEFALNMLTHMYALTCALTRNILKGAWDKDFRKKDT